MAKKPQEDIKALKDTIQQQQDYIIELEAQLEKAKARDLSRLETEKKLNVVHISKYKELEENHERQVEEIRASHKKIADLEKDIRKLKTGTFEVDKLKLQIQELQQKLSRQCSGRPRLSNTPDVEVVRLRTEGKTVKEISTLTGISTATINRILRASVLK